MARRTQEAFVSPITTINKPRLVKKDTVPEYLERETAGRQIPARELSDAEKINKLRDRLLGEKKQEQDPRAKFRALFRDS